MDASPSARELWLACVVAGLRSKLDATVLVLMLATAAWQLASGHVWSSLALLAFTVFFFARIPAAIGIAMALRDRKPVRVQRETSWLHRRSYERRWPPRG